MWSPEQMVAHHVELRRALQIEGPEVVRRHLSEGEHSVADSAAGA